LESVFTVALFACGLGCALVDRNMYFQVTVSARNRATTLEAIAIYTQAAGLLVLGQ